MADLMQLAEQLRAKRKADAEAQRQRQSQELFQQQALNSTPPVVSSGGFSADVAGRQMTSPGVVQVDYMSAVKPLAQAWMANRAGAKADELDAQSSKTQDAARKQMFGNDQEAERLMLLAELGVPGAEDALANKISPRQESLAGATQFVAQGGSIKGIAHKYGLSEEQGAQLEASIRAEQRRTSNEEFERQKALRLLGLEKQQMTDYDRWKNDPEGFAEYRRLMNGEGTGRGDPIKRMMVEAVMSGDPEMLAKAKELRTLMEGSAGLPAGVEGQRAKEILATEKDLQKFDQFTADIAKMKKMGEDKTLFTPGQKAAWTYYSTNGEADAPIFKRVLGAESLREEWRELNSMVTNKALQDMALLGGSDSNEELRKIMAQYPDALSSQKTFQTLTERLEKYENVARRAAEMRLEDLRNRSFFGETAPRKKSYFRAAAEELGYDKYLNEDNPDQTKPAVRLTPEEILSRSMGGK